MNDLIQKAKDFAHRKHDEINQVRKYTNEPYWVHVDAVAATVQQYSGEPTMVAAAYLHDTLEDTNTTYQELVDNFGEKVATLVNELTDVYTSKTFPTMNRDLRKQYEAERLAEISFEAKTIKLADLQNNTLSIVEHDPNFAIVYLKEKARAMKSLVGGHPYLYTAVEKQLKENIDKLNVIV